MKKYTVNDPKFTDSINIVDVTDPAHADNVNAAPKTIFENTLYLKNNLMKPQLLVTVESGATIEVVNGDAEYTKVSDGNVTPFDLGSFGTWTVTATKGGETSAATVEVDTVKVYSVSLGFYKIYGAQWDGTSSSAWSRTDDAEEFTDPVPYMSGATNYSSPFDNIYPWAGMERVTDDEAGELVSIPKYWYRWTRSGTTMKLQIANKEPVGEVGFHVSPAHADRGDGKGERDVVYVGRYHCATSDYKSKSGEKAKVSIRRSAARESIAALGKTIWQYDYAMYWTIAMLYLVEFADWNSQAKIGMGCGDDNDLQPNGLSDEMPYHTGTMQTSRTAGGQGVQYRYIEGLWDGVLNWVDGIYFSKQNVYCVKNPSEFSDTAGGTLVGQRPTSSNYITKWTEPTADGFEYALYPSVVSGGSENTYVCDFCDCSSPGVVLCAGAYWGVDGSYGLFCLGGGYTAANSSTDIGCRLQKLP